MTGGSVNKLGDKLEVAIDMVQFATDAARNRPLTVGEFLAGTVKGTLRVGAAEAVLAEAKAAMAADPAAFFVSEAQGLVSIEDAAERLRVALAAATPFKEAT